MGVIEIIVIVICSAIVAGVIFAAIRRKIKGKGPSGGCGDCAGCPGCGDKKPVDGKRD